MNDCGLLLGWVRRLVAAGVVGWHEDGDNVDTLRAHEADLGARFALVRMYQQWQLPAVDSGSSRPIGTDAGSGATAGGPSEAATAEAAAPPVRSRTDGGRPPSSSTSTTVLVGLAAVLAAALVVRRLTSV